MTKVKVDIDIKELSRPFQRGDIVKANGLIILVDDVYHSKNEFSGVVLWIENKPIISDRIYTPFVHHNNWNMGEFHLTPKGFRVTLEQE